MKEEGKRGGGGMGDDVQRSILMMGSWECISRSPVFFPLQLLNSAILSLFLSFLDSFLPSFQSQIKSYSSNKVFENPCLRLCRCCMYVCMCVCMLTWSRCLNFVCEKCSDFTIHPSPLPQSSSSQSFMRELFSLAYIITSPLPCNYCLVGYM